MKNENKKEKSDLVKIEQKEKDEILQSLIKENEILTKLTKQKITPKEALISLLQILTNQRNRIDILGEDQIMLRTNINRLKNSIDDLTNKNHVFKMLNPENSKGATKVNYKPTEFLSFSSLNIGFNNKKNIKTQNNSIDSAKLLQLSVSDFKKKKLKPINNNKKNK
jgi:hypothetical protein